MKKLVLAGLVIMIGLASPAIARDKRSFHLGGGLGSSQIEVSESDRDLGDISFDENDLGFKV